MVIAVLAAILLHSARIKTRGKSEASAFGNDVLGVGTLLVISLIIVVAIVKAFGVLPRSAMDVLTQATKANPLLELSALAYCIWTIGWGIAQSLKPNGD